MIVTPAAGAAGAAPAPAVRPPAGQAAGGVAPPRHSSSLFMSPWLVGFCIFFGYPLVMSAYLSFTHYDLLSPPRWIGLANYRYLFQDDPQIWPAVKQHALDDRGSRCRCRCCSRSGSR